MPTLVTLSDIQRAREQIAPYVRRTPMFNPAPLGKAITNTKNLSLKLESLQITGSFKPRGAVNKMLSLSDAQLSRGLVTASGGNHGLAVAYVGRIRNQPATVFISNHVPESKEKLLKEWGANVVRTGEVWDDANEAALALAEQTGAAYIHPFSDPYVIAGQGTIGLEILDDLSKVETIIVAIGGGGLASGIAAAIKSLRPRIRVIGVEPAGAPTITTSLQAGKVVAVDEIRTAASSLAGRMTTELVLDHISHYVDEVALVSDDEMTEASRWLWREFGLGTEIGGSAALGALMTSKISVRDDERVCVVVCGSGSAGIN